MKNNKLKFRLYEFAVRFRLIFYIIAAAMVFIPIFIVLITDNGFTSFYSEIFVNIAIAFYIIGKILTSFKKYIEDGVIQWGSIGAIIGFIILLLWEVLR